MIKNYLTAAIRSIYGGKWYSVINVLSLTIGLFVGILAYLFIQDEYSYDRFNEKYDQIYRFTNIESLNGQDRYRAGAMYPMAEVLKEEFPSIEKVARIRHHEDYMGLPLIDIEGKSFLETEFYWIDHALFDIFDLEFIEGNAETALKGLRSLVISKATAERYFGGQSALGKEVQLTADLDINVNARMSETYTMIITGVVEIPVASSIQFDLAGNMLFSTYEKRGSKTNWYQGIFDTYVQLVDGSDELDLEAQFPAFIQKYVDKDIKDRLTLHLQALSGVHLDSLPGDQKTSAEKQVVNVLMIVAFAILLLACINFMNLSTARFTKRAKEVGVRKVVGAMKIQLIFQFLLESVIFSILAMVGAIILVLILLPVFNQLLESNLVFDVLNIHLLTPIMAMTLAVGIFAGVYPAFFLSSFNAIHVLKGQLNSGFKGVLIRKVLVISQFTATVILLIGVAVVTLQTKYLQNANLEIQRDQYAMIRLKEEVYIKPDEYNALKSELLKDASVQNVAGTWSAPFGVNIPVFNYPFKTEGFSELERIRMHLIRADEDFIDAFDIKMLSGRKLSTDFPNDYLNGFVINEQAAKLMGFDDPLGKDLEVFSGGGSSFKTGKVVGVMEDFNFLSLHNDISPLVISMSSNNRYRYMTLKFRPENTAAMLKHATEAWNKFEPGWPIELFFMDEEWKMHYESERRLGDIVQYLTMIAVLIACLGLFALSGFSFEKRRREMSIRKVLGASVSSIYQLLSIDFVKLILVSLVIAAPVGWYLAENWLKEFAYRITMSWWIVVLIGIAMLMITMLTVSYHSLKSANVNPVDNLKIQ